MDNSTPLERINVKRLLFKIKEDFDALIQDDLFLPNTRQEVTSLITPYLESLRERHALNDFRVEAKQPTWEDYYPLMPERLLAIEAVERFGSRLDATYKNIKRVRGYPYRFQEDYWLLLDDGDEYWGCSDTTIPPDQPYRTKTSLVIDDPTHLMQVDLYIRPVEPVHFVTFSITQDIHECC